MTSRSGQDARGDVHAERPRGGPRARALALVVAASVALGGSGGLASSTESSEAVAVDAAPFETVGNTPGLGLETVTALYQDRRGLIWIGTREGLILYDGYTTSVFAYDVADPDSLADNVVRTIAEDRDGRIWIGTNAGGLDEFDPATGTFTHHRHDSTDPATLSHDSVNAILQDRSGSLWIGTQIGLNRMDPRTGVVERIPTDPDDPVALGHPYVYALHEDARGALWVATVGGGLYRREPGDGRFVALSHDPTRDDFVARQKLFAIVDGGDGVLWLASEGGVSKVEPGASTVTAIELDGEADASESPIVTSLVRGPDGILWVGTWGSGLARFDPTRETALAPPPARAGVELTGSRVVALLVDREGAVWAGTWSGGLYRARPAPSGLTTIGADGGLEVSDATAVHVDRAGTLWIGTWGGGVYRRDAASGSLTSIPPNALQTGTVLALSEGVDGRVWIGRMDGLYAYEPTNGAVLAWNYGPKDPSGIGRGYVTSVLEDSDGTMWVGVGGGGLHRLRRGRGTFERLVHRPGDPSSLSDDYVTALAEGGDGTLWVGTRSGGLNALDRATDRFERFVADGSDPSSLSHHGVTAILCERDDRIWVATAGGGLNRGVRSGNGPWSFERFDETDGLIDDNVRAMVTDDDGSLWLATVKGLSRFDPETRRFRNYGSSTLLPSTSFNIDAAARGPDALYFGMSNGILRVERGTPFRPPDPSPTIIRSLSTVGADTGETQPPWARAQLEVAWGKMVSVEFAVLDFEDTRHHRFAYRLDPDEPWIEIGDRRSITFTDLDPGVSVIEARGRNAHGVWSEMATPIRLVVVPPFWMTMWFRLLVVSAIVASVFGAHVYRVSTFERRNRQLLWLKEERERALDEARRSEEALHEAYARLRKLTRRLEFAKEEERKRIARELHDEMGQALTAAKINLQLMSTGSGAATAPARIEDTVDLVDRMIRHVRTLSLDLRPPLLDELGLGAALRGYLEAQSQRSGLDIRVEIDPPPNSLAPELEITTFRTVQEAVTNVVRHAEARRVDVRLRSDDGWIDVSVEDDGKGFDVERTLERAVGGHHLGLLGIRERVEGVGGRVDIRSGPDRGTVIRVRVPIGS